MHYDSLLAKPTPETYDPNAKAHFGKSASVDKDLPAHLRRTKSDQKCEFLRRFESFPLIEQISGSNTTDC